MTVGWLHPAAWWGLAALLLPLAIHLLLRQQSRRMPFPSLRFLRETRLAALRRRTLADRLLLLARAAVLASAVAALAGPVLVSDARRAGWSQRIARAIVVAPAAERDTRVRQAVEAERQGTWVSDVFRTPVDATAWLARQAPAAREVVIVGDLRVGTITEADVNGIPSFTGVRFRPFPSASAASATLVGVAASDTPNLAPYAVDVQLEAAETRLHYRRGDDALPAIDVQADPAGQSYAEAMLRAVLAEGVLFGRAADRRLTVVFAGANAAAAPLTQPASQAWMRDVLAALPGTSGGEREGRLVVRVPRRATDADAPRWLARAVQSAFADSLDALEPRPIPAPTLAAWSRPPGPLPDDLPIADEGDRRWLWGLALILLAIEAWLRRSSTASESATDAQATEARVA